MPTPKKKTSRSKRGMRRSHDSLETPPMARDPKTGILYIPHRAFKGEDGGLYYNGKQIIAPKATSNE
jgi:large subunit ribosomal protein L32